MADEQRLEGGNVSSEVVRVGSTVRRPTGPWTPTVHALLRHLDERAFTGAPRVFGIDEQGREVLEFIEGEVAWPASHHRLLGTADAVARVGRLLRRFHDAVADFDPGADAIWQFPEMATDSAPFVDGRGVVVCHNDPAAWNLVVGDRRWAFIDWDAAGPRPAIWDVAYCAVGVVPIVREAPGAGWDGQVIPTVERLRALVDGYGLGAEDRARLPTVITARVRSSYEHLRRRAMAGIEPWAQLWKNGHGEGWAGMLEFAAEHERSWSRQLGRG